MGANAAKVVLRRHNLYSEEEVDFEGISGDGDIDLMRPNGVLVGHSGVTISGVGSMSEWPMAAVVLVFGTYTIINSISTQFSTRH